MLTLKLPGHSEMVDRKSQRASELGAVLAPVVPYYSGVKLGGGDVGANTGTRHDSHLLPRDRATALRTRLDDVAQEQERWRTVTA